MLGSDNTTRKGMGRFLNNDCLFHSIKRKICQTYTHSSFSLEDTNIVSILIFLST